MRRVLPLIFAALASLIVTQLTAQAQIAPNIIQGVVTSANGPEAGVWVIAETGAMPSRFVKIVVTDDQGRYFLPDLPPAFYSVWVRGYGLIDSPKVSAKPGSELNLTAVVAPDGQSAAHYYPDGYWFAMLKPPAESEFPGTGDDGNGINPAMLSQAHWIRNMKLISQPGVGGCLVCHAMGQEQVRVMEPELLQLGPFESTADAWKARLSGGQMGNLHIVAMNRFGIQPGLDMFADWTDRIAAGELPAAIPPRPQGIERNVVLTEWDWGVQTGYVHDLTSTDRRDPSVNATARSSAQWNRALTFCPCWTRPRA